MITVEQANAQLKEIQILIGRALENAGSLTGAAQVDLLEAQNRLRRLLPSQPPARLIPVTDGAPPEPVTQERSAFLAGLLNYVHDAIVATDENCQITAWNHAAETLYGWKASEVIGRNVTDILPSDLSDQDQQIMLRLLEETGHYETILTQYTRDGRALEIESSRVAILDQEGRMSGYVAANRDLTGRRQTEQALRDSEAKLRRLADSNIIGVFYADTHGKVLDGNDAFLEIIGYTREDLEAGAVSWAKMTPPEYAHTDREHINESRLRGACTPYEKEYIRKDGRRVPILIGYAFLEGSQTDYICYLIDLTTRRQVEEALRESRGRLLLATGAAGIGTWDWNLLTDEFTFDLRACEIYGFHAENPQTYERLLSVIHPEDREAARQQIQQARENGRAYEHEYRIAVPDGGIRWVYVKGQAYPDSAGHMARMMGVVLDMTQRQEIAANARKVLAQTEVQHRLMDQRERERLSIARDLHDGPVQDLIAISFGLQSAAMEAENPAQAGNLQALRAAIHDVVTSLRNYAGELRPPALTKFGLEKAIRSHAETFREKHPEIHLVLHMHQTGPLLPDADRLALYRIYQEAMNNIVRHAHASEVLIYFEKDEQQADFEIRDNGRGFDLPTDWLDLAREGHLGLVGIQERAEAVGGFARFSSKPGHGTSIWIHIPILPA